MLCVCGLNFKLLIHMHMEVWRYRYMCMYSCIYNPYVNVYMCVLVSMYMYGACVYVYACTAHASTCMHVQYMRVCV